MDTLVFDPLIPFALWWPLALAAAGLLAWYATAARQRLPRSRRGLILGLMGVGAAIPLVVLLNPTWLQRVPPPAGKPRLTLLVDASASMATTDASAGVSRYDHATRLAADAAHALADRYEVRVRTFAATWSAASPDELAHRKPEGNATDLGTAIADSLDETQGQGQAVLVLSDGGHNAPGGTTSVMDAVAKAKALAAPVFTHTVGGAASVRDIEVALHLPQELAFVKQRVPVVVMVRQRGNLAPRVNLSLHGQGDAAQPAETREVAVKPDGVAEEIFHVTQEQAGLYRYEVRAETLPGEVTPVNNVATLLLRVVDQPVRVLLLEGKPYWDTKFLVRTLTADQSMELVSVVKLAEGRLLQRTLARPDANPAPARTAKPDTGATRATDWSIRQDATRYLADRETLAKYQIVILGRDAEVFLGEEALRQVKKWLAEDSGALVCYRGPPASQISQRLGELLPVRWTPSSEARFRVQLTGEGRALRWLPATDDGGDVLTGLPSLAGTARVDRPKPLATVLATTTGGKQAQPEPVITYQPVGNGRVVVVEGAGMWRWAFLPAEHRQHDEVYATFWRSLTRWLVSNVGLLPTQRLALRTDKVTFSTEEHAAATLLLRADEAAKQVPRVELRGPDEKQRQDFEPVPLGDEVGQFQVRFGRLPEGRYVAAVAGAAPDEVAAVASFDVRGNPLERLEVRARPELMQEIATSSGGAVLANLDSQQVAVQFDEHLRRSQPERTAPVEAWDRWWLLAIALALWGTGWGVRRRGGLI